jgi:hypothetical protein
VSCPSARRWCNHLMRWRPYEPAWVCRNRGDAHSWVTRETRSKIHARRRRRDREPLNRVVGTPATVPSATGEVPKWIEIPIEPSHEDIARRAYQLYEECDSDHGHHFNSKVWRYTALVSAATALGMPTSVGSANWISWTIRQGDMGTPSLRAVVSHGAMNPATAGARG